MLALSGDSKDSNVARTLRDQGCGISCPTHSLCDPVDAMLMKVFLVNKNTPWNLWQAATGKLQALPQRFQSKPYFSRTTVHLKKQLLWRTLNECIWSYPSWSGYCHSPVRRAGTTQIYCIMEIMYSGLGSRTSTINFMDTGARLSHRWPSLPWSLSLNCTPPCPWGLAGQFNLLILSIGSPSLGFSLPNKA